MNAASQPDKEADVTRLPGWEALPADVQGRLVAAHLPAAFLKRETGAHFVIGPDLSEVDLPQHGRVLRFGEFVAGLGGRFCVGLETGEVVLAGRGSPLFVNSSLDQFARSMAVVAGFERVITTGDGDDCDEAADELEQRIEDLDEAAVDVDTYWGGLLDDVRAGNFSDNDDF